MIEYEITDMTCGHCVGAITKAVEQVAPQAGLDFDLPSHRVRISGANDSAALEMAIREAGYAPRVIENGAQGQR